MAVTSIRIVSPSRRSRTSRIPPARPRSSCSAMRRQQASRPVQAVGVALVEHPLERRGGGQRLAVGPREERHQGQLPVVEPRQAAFKIR